MELAAAAEAAPRKPGLLESIVADVGGALGTGVGAATGGWGVITGTLGDVGGWVAATWGDAAGWMETLGPTLLEVAAGGVLVFAGAEMMAAAAAVEVGGVALDATGVGGIQGAGRQMIEPNEIVSSAADLAKINALVGKLEGQPCWRLKFIYGDELMVAFGAQVPKSAGPLKGRMFGEWELVTRASRWRLFRPDGSEITNADVERKEAEPHFGEVTGRRVKAAAASLPDLDLRIEFDDGTRLDVPCCEDDESNSDGGEGGTDNEDDDIELACWELYMPGGRLLSVWPRGRWALTRLDDD